MCAKGNKFAYQNMLNRIREHKITKNKNLSVNFDENERAVWNSAIKLCYNIVEKRRQNVEQGIKAALILSDVSNNEVAVCPECGCNKLQHDYGKHHTCLNVLCDWQGQTDC